MANINSIETNQPLITTFKGEGYTYHFRQGMEAISGVYAHEARNIRLMKQQAVSNGYQVINTSIEIKFAYDPKTKKLIVIGGESNVKYTKNPIESPNINRDNILNLLNEDGNKADQTSQPTDITNNEANNEKDTQQINQDDEEYLKNILLQRKTELEQELGKVQQQASSMPNNNSPDMENDYEVFVINGLTERPADINKREEQIKNDLKTVQNLLQQIQQKEDLKQQENLLNNVLNAMLKPALNILNAKYEVNQNNAQPSNSSITPRPDIFLAPYTMSGLNVNLRVF